jgi:hypothetical protein
MAVLSIVIEMLTTNPGVQYNGVHPVFPGCSGRVVIPFGCIAALKKYHPSIFHHPKTMIV